MENIINELLLSLNQQIQGIDAENSFHFADQSLKVVQEAREKLDLSLSQYAFSSQEEEIHYFKYLHPKIYQELNYYFELYQMEAKKPITGKKNTQKYLNGILNTYQHYIEKNQDLYDYYRLKNTHLDQVYFTRQRENTELAAQDLTPCKTNNPKVLSNYANIMARFQALEKVTVHIQKDIDALNFQPMAKEGKNPRRLIWTDPKAALIELSYALHSKGAINNGNASLKAILSVLQEAFQIDVGAYHVSYQNNIRIRKISRTLYLDLLKKRLEERMNDCDENPRFH